MAEIPQASQRNKKGQQVEVNMQATPLIISKRRNRRADAIHVGESCTWPAGGKGRPSCQPQEGEAVTQ